MKQVPIMDAIHSSSLRPTAGTIPYPVLCAIAACHAGTPNVRLLNAGPKDRIGTWVMTYIGMNKTRIGSYEVESL